MVGFQLGRARAYSSTDCPVDELSDLMGEDSVNNHVAMRIMKINLSLIWVRVEKETGQLCICNTQCAPDVASRLV